MGKNAELIAITSIAIGVGVPAICLWASYTYGLNTMYAAVLSGVAVVVSALIALTGVALGPLGSDDGSGSYDRQRLEILRESNRSTLEEIDDIVKVLEEIHNALKAVEE
jgi:aromatic ring-opening dioxygenase LigB subunit